MATIYTDRTYLVANPTWHVEDSAWKARKIAALLRKNSIQPDTICEIGCGAGEVIRTLASGLLDAIVFNGYEISPQAFEICRANERGNLHYYLGDVLADDQAYFDLVLAIDVIEHVEDYFGFLRRLQKKGTYKVFHIPLDLSAQSVLRRSRLLRERTQVGHLHYFTKETALATLRDTGYEIIDFAYTDGSLDLPTRGWKAKLAKFPRRVLSMVDKDLTARFLGGFSLLVLTR